jgi:preprotein translocase subunit SecA
MKKLLFLTALLAAFSLVAFAQPRRGQQGEQAKEKIEAYKIAFFTEKLQLTPEESKTFWPLFNQFENERDALREKFDLDGKRFELMSDKEVEDAIAKHIDAEEQMVKLRRDYVQRFKQVLPIRKVALLQRIDQEFKRHLLEEMKRRRENRQGGGAGGKQNFRRN